MLFQFNTMFAQFWLDMSMMLEDVYGYQEKSDTMVLLGHWLVKSPIKYKEENDGRFKKLIVYQTEPLVQNHWWSKEYILKQLEGADEVWDYDYENVLFLRENGINAKYRPPQYSKSIKRIKNSDNPDIDVLFYGTWSQYRYEYLSFPVASWNYNASQFNIVVVHNICGGALDDLISRSKIILNLNPYEGECRQQQPRINYALTNNKCVISQKNNINYYGDKIVEFDTKEDLLSKLVYLLDNEKWRDYTNNEYIQQSGDIYKHYSRLLNM